MRCTAVLVALLAGSALAASALAQGASPGGSSAGGTPPAVSAAPVPAPTGGIVGTVANPAPGTTPGAPLPVGRNGPVTAGMTFGGPQPNPGRNSFTRVQAARRIARAGFTGVAGLQKDQQGVWRGHATRGGVGASVWLDYTGRVGTS